MTALFFRLSSVLFLFLLLVGCGDDDEIRPIEMITFDNLQILYDILPPGYYSKVRFTSQNTAYTITTKGKIFKTEDGGNTWIQQESGTEMHLYNMFFLNDLNGYIVGGEDINEGILLKTMDGGNTWSSINFHVRLSSIYFINETTGFAAGRKLFRTRDGGETWNEVDLGYFAYGSLNFFDEITGFLTTGNVVLKTIDGGNNWLPINNVIGNYSIKQMQIFDDIAFLLSNGTKIFITPDRGNTWQVINTPSTNSVYFINERQAIGVGQHWYELGYFPNGVLCITNNGGKYWEEKYFPADEFYSLNDIDFSNDSTALAIGNSPKGCVIKLKFK